MSLSQKEANNLVRLLDKLEWPMPPAVFRALMRRIRSVPIELGIFRGSLADGTLEVLLTQRPRDDMEFTPHAWHVPGTPIWPDQDIGETIDRLKVKEQLGKFTTPQFIGIKDVGRQLAPSRPMIALLHVATANSEYSGAGRFFKITRLPHTILPLHRPFIGQMVEFIKTGQLC